MTAPNGSASVAITASNIESVDAFARQLYRRARTAGHDFTDIATVVRGLHTVLNHLRVEAEDPDSLLNSNPNGDNQNSLYARQLLPIVEDCDFTLKQLDTILEKYGGGSSGDSADDEHAGRNGRRSKEVEAREKDMIALIRTKLANQKTNIDIFLDTVQLHNPVKARRPLQNPNAQQLDQIKDKVDAIATRLFHRRGIKGSEDDEELWQQFRIELEKEGFSSDVLRSNKEILRAYIRELDSHDLGEDGAPQSVRGLLGNGSSVQGVPPMTVTPASYTDPEAFSPKESFHRFDNEKFSPDVKTARLATGQAPLPPLDPHIPQALQPYHRSQPQPQPQPQPTPTPAPPAERQVEAHRPAPPLYHHHSSNLSYDQHRTTDSSDTDSHSSQDMALISTRDLMNMDYRQAELVAARMGAMHLGPQRNLAPNYSHSADSASGGRYLPPPAERLSIMPSEHQLSSSPGSHQQLVASPRYLPPYPVDYSQALSPTSSVLTPPPAYGSSPTTAGVLMPAFPNAGPSTGQLNPAQRYSRLAPDSQGREIPLEAKWTRIKRSLVSPVVLDKAGVRYEARPEFVAVLGVVSRDKIEEWARQSAEVRNARRRDGGDEKRERARERDTSQDTRRTDRKQFPVRSPSGGRRNETYNDREHRRRKGGLSSDDSESDVLWDESDTTEDERLDDKGRYKRDRYMPRNRSRDDRRNGDKDEKHDRDGESKGSTFIPIIVPPPMGEKGSGSASTVGPKPILKNRNTNHVRFDPDGPKEFLSEDMSRSPRPRDDRDRHRHRDDRDRERDRSSRRDRDRERERNRDRDHDRERDHHHHRHHGRDRDRERERERERERDRERDKERDRERDKERDRDPRREDKAAKKSALRETLGAVGIGGAAASLLSVLTEAASGL